MADTGLEVTGGQSAVVSEGTNSAASVPQGTTGQATSDANELLAKIEDDRRKQQGVYDRKIAELEQRNKQLSEQLNERLTANMTEAERIAHENQTLKERLAEIEQEKTLLQYRDAFVQRFKLDATQLDMSNQEALVQSAWDALGKKLEMLEQGTQPTQPAGKQPPQNSTKTITGSGGLPKSRPTMPEMMQNVARALNKPSVTEEEFWQTMERNPDAMNQWLKD